MILKLGMLHWGLKLYKSYINDDPVLTLTYFMARSNYVTLHLSEESCYTANQSQISCGASLGSEKDLVYINGTGHMIKMAAMLFYGKYLQKSSPEQVVL